MRNFKQLLLIIAVSAVSAVGSVWIYSKTAGKNSVYTQAKEANLPANYS